MAMVSQKRNQAKQQQCHSVSLQEVAAGLVSTLLWCLSSSLLIIYNKELYDNGFPFPLMVTGMGQVRFVQNPLFSFFSITAFFMYCLAHVFCYLMPYKRSTIPLDGHRRRAKPYVSFLLFLLF